MKNSGSALKNTISSEAAGRISEQEGKHDLELMLGASAGIGNPRACKNESYDICRQYRRSFSWYPQAYVFVEKIGEINLLTGK